MATIGKKHALMANTRCLKSLSATNALHLLRCNIVTNALDERMQLLAQNVQTPTDSRVVVFNPLPWKRSGEVAVNEPGGIIHFFAKDIPPCGYKTFNAPADSGSARVPRAVSGVAPETSFSPTSLKKIVAQVAQREACAPQIENQFFRLKVDVVRGTVRH